jgi:hypothetical protein
LRIKVNNRKNLKKGEREMFRKILRKGLVLGLMLLVAAPAVAQSNGDLHVVPEPSTMLLLASGLVGLWGLRRKFKK